ncbi:MAG: hypothetical protein ACRDO7_07790 [Nocardioidaceae bacterium]
MTSPDARTRRRLEVACDESGWEGENLIASNTDVFAHASVHVDLDSAVHAVQEVRDRIRSPATEYKANHLLRSKHRPVLEWVLGPGGPLHRSAHVRLVDKAYFVVRVAVGVLTEDRDAAAIAHTLNGQGSRTFGRARWHAFLVASNGSMRTKVVGEPVDMFFDALDALHSTGAHGRIGEIVELLRGTRPQAVAYRESLRDDPAMVPVLDPLAPAIVRAARYWTEFGASVSIVHDRQNTLTEERIEQIAAMFDAGPSRGRLSGLRLVQARLDARVQLADFLAGVARKIASDELNGRGDATLTTLLRPYVDPLSVWDDDRSRLLLGAPTAVRR